MSDATETTQADGPEITRRAEIFPELSDALIEEVKHFGTVETVEAGTQVFTVGDRDTDFIVLLSAEFEITLPADGTEYEIAEHFPREFTGELDMFSTRTCLVNGRVRKAGEIIRVPRPKFRELIGQNAELSELVMRAFILRRVQLLSTEHQTLTVVGSEHSSDTLRVRRFLVRNGHPYRFVDIDGDDDVGELLDAVGYSVDEIPILICGAGKVVRNPGNELIADALGLSAPIDHDHIRDVVVVGAGPSGLAASVYAASEGLDTLVIEPEAPGGQAGTSSKIENYLGFPTGISGQALAGRAMSQAQKFGAVIAVSRSVTKIDCTSRPYKLHLSDGEMVPARAVVLACGARYRQLSLDGIERYEGKGVHFAATAMEGGLCAGHEVVVIGGGNSAGQAAVFLSQRASHVHMLVRSKGLADSMSRYLSARIDASPDITLYTESELAEVLGKEWVEEAAWRHRVSGEETRRPVRHIFVMIGAVPNTGWLDGCVALDEAGFVRTGPVGNGDWSLERPPFSLETSRPGIFAVGDVRTGSVKRVASAVGEGSMSIQFVHQILND